LVESDEAALELFCEKVAETYRIHTDRGYPEDLNDLVQYLLPQSDIAFERIAGIVGCLLLDASLKLANLECVSRWQRLCRVCAVGAATGAVPQMIEVLQHERLLIEYAYFVAAFRLAVEEPPQLDEGILSAPSATNAGSSF
jgi:hypothetical protein